MTDSRDWMRMELEKVRTIEADNAALRERAEQAEDVLAGLTDVIRTAEREHLNRFDGTADLRAVVARLGYRDVGTLAALRERVRVLEGRIAELEETEHGRVLDQLRTLEADNAALLERVGKLEAENAVLVEVKDGAYSERNKLVAFLASLYPSSLERHPDEDTEWEDDWRWVVYIDLPNGQASWHLHDSELSQFDGLPRLQGRVWEGHTTEQKYERLAALAAVDGASGEGES